MPISREKSRHGFLSSSTLSSLAFCLIQSRPTPYCLPWPSSTIWDCILCTSPFSPSVCASQPPFLDIHPTPLHPLTAPMVREKKERTEQFQTRRHKSHIQSSLFSSPSWRTSLLYSSARQCPRPRRNEGFFSLEHEKDCQIIRNPTSPTEPPAWALDTYAPAEVVGQRTNKSWNANTAKRGESVLGKYGYPDLDL